MCTTPQLIMTLHDVKQTRRRAYRLGRSCRTAASLTIKRNIKRQESGFYLCPEEHIVFAGILGVLMC
jgi:hypothetical protein